MKVKSYTTSKNVSRAIIALHGWTGNIHSMEPVTKMLKMNNTKWVLLEAPYKSSKAGFSWFNKIKKNDWHYLQSFIFLSKTILSLKKEGFRSSQIFILGFSQGACISIEFIIRQKFSIGGIIPISGFIRFKKEAKIDATNESKETSILLLHGENDKVIDCMESKEAFKTLRAIGYPTFIELFSTGHKIPVQARDIIQDFIYS